MSMPDELKKSVGQDPLTKIMMAVIIAVLIWVGRTVYISSITLAEQGIRIEQMQENITNFNADRYTGSQATADQQATSQRLGRLELMVQRLSDRLRALEMNQ